MVAIITNEWMNVVIINSSFRMPFSGLRLPPHRQPPHPLPISLAPFLTAFNIDNQLKLDLWIRSPQKRKRKLLRRTVLRWPIGNKIYPFNMYAIRATSAIDIRSIHVDNKCSPIFRLWVLLARKWCTVRPCDNAWQMQTKCIPNAVYFAWWPQRIW